MPFACWRGFEGKRAPWSRKEISLKLLRSFLNFFFISLKSCNIFFRFSRHFSEYYLEHPLHTSIQNSKLIFSIPTTSNYFFSKRSFPTLCMISQIASQFHQNISRTSTSWFQKWIFLKIYAIFLLSYFEIYWIITKNHFFFNSSKNFKFPAIQTRFFRNFAKNFQNITPQMPRNVFKITSYFS